MGENMESLTIPDELLEMIAGGALSAKQRNQYAEVATHCKEKGFPLEITLGGMRSALESELGPEDWAKAEDIIRAIYSGDLNVL